MTKLKMWQQHPSWEEAEKKWDEGAQEARLESPIKSLKQLPNIPGITQETKKYLRWKSLKYMMTHDVQWKILKNICKHPIRYGWRYFTSLCSSKSFSRDDDFFLYGVENLEEFTAAMHEPEALLVIGFSYCQKPFECPSGRFTDKCVHQADHPVCRQCDIGKTLHTLPQKNTIPLIIPTIHYIGEKIFDVVHRNPSKKILFLITACELTLEMFGDFGRMVNIQGVGVRLDGRICNTMRAFELSEKGVKPGLTVVEQHTQKRILDLLKIWRSKNQCL